MDADDDSDCSDADDSDDESVYMDASDHLPSIVLEPSAALAPRIEQEDEIEITSVKLSDQTLERIKDLQDST